MMGYGLRIRRVYKPGVDCRDYGLVLRPVGFDVYSQGRSRVDLDVPIVTLFNKSQHCIIWRECMRDRRF